MKLTWRTEKRKVKDLIPYEKNPRKISDKQMADLRKSLQKFDLVEIPVVNTDNKIIAGHQRAKLLFLEGRGEEEIEVRIPSRTLTESEVAEYNIRSNQNRGEFDFDLLEQHFDPLELEEWGFEKISWDTESELPEEEIELKPYKKVHILLSFPPDKLSELKPHLEEILKLGIEYEQSVN